MSANCPNQATARDTLATLLQTKLMGPPQLVDDVKPSRWKLEGKTVVMVDDNGVERLDATLDADTNDAIFHFLIFVFVPFGEDQAGWDETDATNLRALIEKYITDCLIDNVETDDWHYIAHEGKSTADTIIEGGIIYKYAEIPIAATNFTR